MRYIILLGFFLGSLYAVPLHQGDRLAMISLKDQHGLMHYLDENISKIIVTYDKKSSLIAHKFIQTHTNAADYLQKHHILCVADISHVPSVISKVFILPKIRKYPYPILLIMDTKKRIFGYVKKKIALYDLKDGVIEKISYADSQKSLQILLK